MPNSRSDFATISKRDYVREGCHVSRLGRILIKRVPIASRANPVHSPSPADDELLSRN